MASTTLPEKEMAKRSEVSHSQGQTYTQGQSEAGPSTAQPVVMVQGPVILYTSPAPSTHQEYRHKRALGLGLAQITCGVLIIMLQLVLLFGVTGGHVTVQIIGVGIGPFVSCCTYTYPSIINH